MFRRAVDDDVHNAETRSAEFLPFLETLCTDGGAKTVRSKIDVNRTRHARIRDSQTKNSEKKTELTNLTEYQYYRLGILHSNVVPNISR